MTSVCVQGNYDQYVQTRLELEENQMKKFNWEQDQIAHMKVLRAGLCGRFIVVTCRGCSLDLERLGLETGLRH